MGAGVDHLLAMSTLPGDIPIVRLVDANLKQDMFTYISDCIHTSQILQEHALHDIKVTVLGLGEIGSHVAQQLHKQGFIVRGWRNRTAAIPGIQTYSAGALHQAVEGVNIVINLLPLTPATEDILNQSLFRHLAEGACVINVARGAHLVDEDLIAAISSGQLSEAYLDVFRVEPLPAQHSLRNYPQIHITPHIASITDPVSVAPQIVANYHKLLAGQPLNNVISRQTGY
jgi:glyoxylate/hydroxypyruvate reductase A